MPFLSSYLSSFSSWLPPSSNKSSESDTPVRMRSGITNELGMYVQLAEASYAIPVCNDPFRLLLTGCFQRCDGLLFRYRLLHFQQQFHLPSSTLIRHRA
jgi:hypothetical protein